MEVSCVVGLNDLPDEILMIIFQKLSNFDVMYSLFDVNRRLHQIVRDPIFTSRLTLIKWMSNNIVDLFSYDMIRDRFLQVLPEIHDQIQRFDLESSSMKDVLRIADYPNLHTLGLYNLNRDSVRSLCTDEILSSGMFKNQIRTLLIAIDNENQDYVETQFLVQNILIKIFTVFLSLIDLILFESSYKNRVRLCLHDPPPSTFYSSTLLNLSIRVQSFADCLYIVDGRFNQLQTLFIDLNDIRPAYHIPNQNDIPNLKCFSLSCEKIACFYEEVILTLLYRMSNLEELGLCLPVSGKQRFIDGNHLKENILDRMSRLKQYSFYIRSEICISNQMYSLLKENFEGTMIDSPKTGILSYLDYFPETERCLYHIYSYPFGMPYYYDISNRFPGGLFQYVRVVSLYDEYPFEHEFFLRIHKSFPSMEKLSLRNGKSQNRKESNQSNNDDRDLSVIQYSFLNELRLVQAHDDYIEQFLFDTKTCFNHNLFLLIKYQSLERVTHNFTRDTTRINCAKVNQLHLVGEFTYSNSLHEYFPCAEI